MGTTSAAQWWTSFALLGALLFAAGDLGLRLFYHPDPLESPYRSWIVSALADYPKMPPKPKIAIFGSSLVVATVNDGDATTLGQEIDGTTHHRSITLERTLAGTAAQGPTTQSFAIGGQMASDAFAILNTLFNNSDPKIKSCFSPPATIVWGIAPRDLMDATFLDPYSSTTVSYLDKLTEKHDSLGMRKFYFWRYLEELADNCFYSYGQRDHFLVLQKQTMYSLLGILGLIRPEDMGTVKTPQELLRIARRELPEDNGLHQWMVKPQTQPISQFEDNSKEYTARYNPFKQKLFDSQMGYLDKFLALARQLGIKVLLVNMPLTRDNLALIPAGKYQLYLDSVRRAAAANDAAFIDYNDDKTFTREYFNDMVHLNGYGSRRFFQMVGDEIKKLNMPI
ncbi:MAG: hypothetical protein JST01_23395 [Cyanobacteria bacterium SZAS TMP-1]|nr:hypothetical protein [Cyanobacteria bacterium SZAS TMP-1]